MGSLYEAVTGLAWPKTLAYIVNGEHVTWAALKATRIKKQKEHLRHILDIDGTRRCPCMLWTFFVPGEIYGGWHLYLRTLHNSAWIRPRFSPGESDGELALKLMEDFPCGFLPIPQNFYHWKEAFARTYPFKYKRGGKPQGILFGWTDLRYTKDYPRNFIPAGHL
jgi:hypothetical protein